MHFWKSLHFSGDWSHSFFVLMLHNTSEAWNYSLPMWCLLLFLLLKWFLRISVLKPLWEIQTKKKKKRGKIIFCIKVINLIHISVILFQSWESGSNIHPWDAVAKIWRAQYLSWERAVNWNCVIYIRNYQNCQSFVFTRVKRNAFLCPLMGIASCLLYVGTILCSQDFMHSAVISLSIVSPYLDWFADRIPILLRQMYHYHFKL